MNTKDEQEALLELEQWDRDHPLPPFEEVVNDWRKGLTFIHNPTAANNARRALQELLLYPTDTLEGDAHAFDANVNRARLHQMVDELRPADLHATADLVRLLALFPAGVEKAVKETQYHSDGTIRRMEAEEETAITRTAMGWIAYDLSRLIGWVGSLPARWAFRK